MAGPIYKLWMVRATEAGQQLSEEEFQTLAAKVDEAMRQVGAKRILGCNSGWADESVQWWGVDEYPDIEAEQKYYQLLTEMNWFRFVESRTLLGTKWD
jgi:hypothetical protein